MDVKCRQFVEYDSIADLMDIDFAALPKPVKHIGGGSNLLFTKDFVGTVLHSKINFFYELPKDDSLYRSGDEVLVSVGAGVPFDEFCNLAAENGLWGPENLSHIPGEVGAAAVQNIGAYGVEAADIIRQVYCYDIEEEEFTHFSPEECRYGYRDSIFKHEGCKDRYIVTNVVFALTRKSSPRLEYGHIRAAVEEAMAKQPDGTGLSPMLVRETVTAIRRQKLPEVSETGSAGSFFKNPVVPEEDYERVQKIAGDIPVPHYTADGGIKIPAAWLIEQCGWKGHIERNAGVYERQPLVIVNATGHASPEEIISLKDSIIDSVKEKFGISLSPEVEIV